MIVQLYMIKDELSEFTTPIIVAEDDAQAKRSFREHVANSGMMRNNPEDFSLWKTCGFDTKTGKVEPIPFPELIERAGATRNGNES